MVNPMPYYAYSTMLYLTLPPVKAIKRLMELGSPVELSYDNFSVFGGKAVEDKYIDEVIRFANSFSNSVRAIHTPYDELLPQIALAEMGIRRFVKWLELSYKLGINVAVVHTLRIDEGYEKALDLNIEFLRLLAKEAKDRGIIIAVENRLERNLFGSKPRDILSIVDGLGEEIGVCLDVGHANINKNLEEFFSIVGRHIVAMHLHDNDGLRDLHKPPYSGTVKWKIIEEWITRTKFNGTIIFEVVCKDSITVCDSIVNQIKLTPIANIT